MKVNSYQIERMAVSGAIFGLNMIFIEGITCQLLFLKEVITHSMLILLAFLWFLFSCYRIYKNENALLYDQWLLLFLILFVLFKQKFHGDSSICYDNGYFEIVKSNWEYKELDSVYNRIASEERMTFKMYKTGEREEMIRGSRNPEELRMKIREAVERWKAEQEERIRLELEANTFSKIKWFLFGAASVLALGYLVMIGISSVEVYNQYWMEFNPPSVLPPLPPLSELERQELDIFTFFDRIEESVTPVEGVEEAPKNPVPLELYPVILAYSIIFAPMIIFIKYFS